MKVWMVISFLVFTAMSACHQPLSEVAVYQPPSPSRQDMSMEVDTFTSDMSTIDQFVAPTCNEEGPVKVYAVHHMNFAEVSEGITAGFNVDQNVSMSGDSTSCGHADFIGLDGAMGIDNQFAAVIPLLNPFLAQPLNEALTRTIQEKAFIIIIEILGIDDEMNDGLIGAHDDPKEAPLKTD